MNFTIADLLFSSFAFLLFAVFLIPPGYALGWALDLAGFRKQDPGVRFLFSLPLSIALMPILTYLAGRYSFDWPITAIYSALFALFLLVCQVRGLRISRIVWIASACWIAIAFLSLSDLQLGKKLYYSVVAYDLNFRATVTGAFARARSLPAANPFFSNGTPQPFCYHYFWFMMCSLPIRLAQAVFGYTGLMPRHAVIASSAWVGLAMFALAALYGQLFLEWEAATRRRVTVIALLLFGLSGLDIIPLLMESSDGLLPTMDWWNSDQVTGWLDSLLWVPHSLGGLAACLTGFLILWNRPRWRWQDSVAAGLCFASGTGLSIYVTLAFAVCATVWTIRAAWLRQWSIVLAWAVSGTFAAAFALPFLRELASRPGAQGSFAALEVRYFFPVMWWLESMGKLNGALGTLANLVCLPLNYFLEFGFFLLAAWWGLRRKQGTPAESAVRVMLLSTLVLCTFVRSITIQMNDLGARGMLVAQFVLLLWGASWLAERNGKSWLVKAALAVGICSSIFELGLLRFYPVLADNGIVAGNEMIDPDDDLGARNFSARHVYERLDRILPATAVVQHNPSDAQDIMAGLYANRQFAIMDRGSATTFTGGSAGPEAVMKPLQDLFEGKRQDPAAVCRQLGIDALIVKDIDPVWDDKTSWVWTAPVLAKASLAVAVQCR